MLSERTQAGPDARSLARPAAKKISAKRTQTSRTGQRYSPLAFGAAPPRRRRISASTAQASPQRANARAPKTKTSSASKWWTLPKLCGSPSR